MRLLVSVRSRTEVAPALDGGADIIDAKEPSQGSLGPVSAAVMAEILAQLPLDRAVSVALGDLTSPDQVIHSIGSLDLPPRPGDSFVKLGFAGVRAPERVQLLIATAVAAAAALPASPGVIAVAYADAARAQTVAAELISHLAERAGAAGVLLDTHTKDGIGLLGWLDPAALATWISSAKAAGLLAAVAGELRLENIETVCGADPDVLGVRGAACEGGRRGRVSAERVRKLCQRIDRAFGATRLSRSS